MCTKDITGRDTKDESWMTYFFTYFTLRAINNVNKK